MQRYIRFRYYSVYTQCCSHYERARWLHPVSTELLCARAFGVNKSCGLTSYCRPGREGCDLKPSGY